MGGDFNCPLDIKKDKKGERRKAKTKLIQSMDEMQTTFNLQDIWRVKHPNKIRFTWHQNSPEVFCRLAYWLISNTLHDLVIKTNITHTIRSDHSAITLRLKTETLNTGYWKLNKALLEKKSIR